MTLANNSNKFVEALKLEKKKKKEIYFKVKNDFKMTNVL